MKSAEKTKRPDQVVGTLHRVDFKPSVGLGVLVGRWVKPFIPEKNLKQGFAYFLIGIGSWVILRPCADEESTAAVFSSRCHVQELTRPALLADGE